MAGSIRTSIIVAVADNGVIGNAGDLPWRISSELKNFRRLTMGKPLVMGRKTFESIGGPLDGRDMIVVTRNSAFEASGVHIVGSLEAGVETGKRFAKDRGVDEVMVIGGGEIYRAALAFADRIYLSEIHTRPDGDTTFPDLDPQIWQETSREAHAAGPKDSADFSVVVLERDAKERSSPARQATAAN